MALRCNGFFVDKNYRKQIKIEYRECRAKMNKC